MKFSFLTFAFIATALIQNYTAAQDTVTPTKAEAAAVEPEDDGETRQATAKKGTVVIDGKIDDAWQNATGFKTTREVAAHNTLPAGEKPATAEIKCMWDEGHLYCLAVVTDPKIELSADEAWDRDSVEFFIDAGFEQATEYDSNDAQYRTAADGAVTTGTGGSADNYESKVTKTETGYIVEARILMETAAGKKIGFDAQVNNDAGAGTRESTAKWNDTSNDSTRDPSGFGVLKLVE